MSDINKFYVRLPVSVSIFDAKTHELVYKTHSTKKAVVRASCLAWQRQNAGLAWIGECKIIYNRELDIWNAFTFTNYAILDRNLRVCTEKEFLLELVKDGSLEKRFLEKRKISEKQKAILREYAARSPLFKKK